MTTPSLPSLAVLKSQAKSLRSGLAASDHDIGHSQSLELIAQQYGFRDWNTLHAAAGNRPAPRVFAIGARVSGHYLGHAFDGELIAARAMSGGSHHEITVKFDTPIDVVASPHMSAFRQRVTAVIDADGKTAEKTSDGQPHLRLDLSRMAARQ